MKYSEYQQTIFQHAISGSGHAIVEAKAGSGKTTTLLEYTKYIPPTQSWIAVAFNSENAKELKARLGLSVNGSASTLHSFGNKALIKAFKKVSLNEDKVSILLTKVLGNDKKLKDLKFQLERTVSLSKNILISSKEEIDDLMDTYGIDHFEYDRENFIELVWDVLEKCKNQPKIVDYDDMIWLPTVCNLSVPHHDHILVDEYQDLNKAQLSLIMKTIEPVGKKRVKKAKPEGRIVLFGDRFQCVEFNTLTEIIRGEEKQKLQLKDVKIGDKISCYKNGNIEFLPIKNIQNSEWKEGIEITTQSGKKLLMSPNHKIWASEPDHLKNKYIVYLMYRKDLGFRVGKTNKWKRDKGISNFGNRANSEKADRLWVLDIVNSNDEALLLEETYSLRYGIPTYVFCGKNRGLNQEKINKIFEIFGQNGLKILNDKFLSFDYPHWMPQGTSINKKYRNKILLVSHILPNKIKRRRGYSLTSLEWSNLEINSILEKNNISYSKNTKTDKNNFRLRKSFNTYVDCLKFANNLSQILNLPIYEKIYFKGNRNNPLLLTASGLHVGMKVLSLTENKDDIEHDLIVKIENKPGTFIDLEVEDVANFFGNGILSHNSIYQFRGANQNNFEYFRDELQAKVLPLSISYRCPIKVIEEAKKLVPEIEASPTAIQGKVEWITLEQMKKQIQPGCFVLSRTNAPLLSLALNFLKNRIPCIILGKDFGLSLISMIRNSNRSSIKDFLKYLDSWAADEIERLQEKNKDLSLIQDRVACYYALSEGCDSISQLIETIQKLFDNEDRNYQIILSTVHKCKGKEHNIVYILNYTFFKSAEEDEVEKNIKYVAITRSADQLYFVTSDKTFKEKIK